jgi:hypothetical protein
LLTPCRRIPTPSTPTLHAFEQQGLRSVRQRPQSGAVAHHTGPAERDFTPRRDRPYGTGSALGALVASQAARLSTASEVGSGHQPRAPTTHPEKRGLSLRRVRRKLVSSDPQRPAILSRIRQIWQPLPDHGVLLFFDVKPVYVKAYGGRRYTSAPRLVLPRQQRTRGRFYGFAVYEVHSGRVRWAFRDGKSSPFVIGFLRQIRHW